MPSPTIGFVGVGRMGANMARRLHQCGHRVARLHDLHAAAATALAEELGATAVPSPAAVTAGAEVVFTVVSDDEAMQTLFGTGPESLLPGAQGRVFINCATVSPAVHTEVERACAAVGAASLEACMASSIPQARNGTLYLMIGGDESLFARHRALLQDLSQDLQYVGPAGSAAQVKALVNMVMNINTAGLAEGLGLGQALGLDLAMLQRVFAQTGARSRVLETDAEDMIQREYDCFFSAAHAAKDSGIANALAAEVGLRLPLSLATEAQYRRLVEAGKGELDKSAVAELTFPGRV